MPRRKRVVCAEKKTKEEVQAEGVRVVSCAETKALSKYRGENMG